MKVLVTGITGFIGGHLASELRQRGHLVGGLVRGGTDLPATLASLPTWPVGPDHDGIDAALAAFQPDVVAHLAALFVAEHQSGDVLPLVRANIEYGARLLDAMRVSGCRALVHAGTSWQHRHDREYCPVNLYAATKQAFSTLAEYYLDAVGLRLLELHLYDSYGEDDGRRKLINLLKLSAQSSDELAMSEGAQRIHLVHVDDLARGFAMACEQVAALPAGTRRVYRLPSAHAVSLRELVTVFNAIDPGRPVRVRWGARPYRVREVFEPWEDADVLPGWRPEIALETGLRRVRAGESSKEHENDT